jgi:hypothetical protein
MDFCPKQNSTYNNCLDTVQRPVYKNYMITKITKITWLQKLQKLHDYKNYKNYMKRSSKFELSWIVQLMKKNYILHKWASLGRAALELRATPQLLFLRSGPMSQCYDRDLQRQPCKNVQRYE